ncbi:aryl-sulfate sulfotransferase [Arthrobacter sp. ISL-48]|nr:arylsulfotransferase family protein [Arthrobacter sp. ISL-48]MBT2533015.1 aryl-sulfate sulfotransferase [Arthrobacter sp. ISL-48]
MDNAFDAFHLNSVDDDGDALLVSSRHTHTLYQIGRKSGEVRWRMGGKKSDFAVADQAVFAWQHDARRRSATLISVFDNHFAEETSGTSRGLLLAVDEEAKTVTLKQEFANAGHGGNAEGNVQLLANGNVMVGWGADPSATEFTADGTAVFEAAGLGNGCYRVYRFPWTAQPDTPPSMAVKNGAGQSIQVFASWNGATEVASWRVLTGPDSSALAAAGTVPRSGFETMVAVASAKYAAVQALASDGSVLGTSAVTAAS